MSLLTPAEAAKKLKVSPITLRKWADSGLIEARVTIGGHRRYLANEVERLATRQHSRGEQELKVLIVDDDPMMIELMRDLLHESGHRLSIEIALDGFDAGRKLVTFEPQLMFLDLMMPGLDGFEVCRRVMSANLPSRTRVIAMTGYPTKENVARILAEGAEACLPKPVSRSTLISILDQHTSVATNRSNVA
jgi:excisionase family DNA binding protein